MANIFVPQEKKKHKSRQLWFMCKDPDDKWDVFFPKEKT